MKGLAQRTPRVDVTWRGLLATLFAGIGVASCSPAVWNGVAAGLAAAGQAPYYSPQAVAQENRVCVKYQTTNGWSQGYYVEGSVLKGSELNRQTRTFSYDAFATYVVIFWGPGEASILKLDSYFGSIPAYALGATDQRGRRWTVSSNRYCY